MYKEKVYKLKNWIVSHRKISIVILVVALFAIYKILSSGSGDELNQVVAKRMDIVDTINATGKVVSANDVVLSFEKSGRLGRIYAPVGTKVRVGTTIASLSNSDLVARVMSATADRDAQDAVVRQLRRGARPEDLRIKELEALDAKKNSDEAKKAYVNTLLDAFTKADDAVRNKSDQFFSAPRSSSPQLTAAAIPDGQLRINLESERYAIETKLGYWSISVRNITSESDIEKFSVEAENNLQAVRKFLDDLSLAINSVTESGSITRAILDGWRADVLSARTNVNTALSNIQSARERVSSTEIASKLADQRLQLAQNGSTNEDIDSAEAKLRSFDAAVLGAQAELEKTIIRAPFDGIVTRQNASVGEIVSANEEVVGLISENSFEIEVFIPEVEVAYAKVGNIAEVTLDALNQSDIFSAVISSIDPAETVVDGVSTYKAVLQFTAQDPRIRSGMTANLNITARRANDVIGVPLSFVFLKDGKRYLSVIRNGKTVEVPVVTGIEGSGFVEISAGLKEGEVVLLTQ